MQQKRERKTRSQYPDNAGSVFGKKGVNLILSCIQIELRVLWQGGVLKFFLKYSYQDNDIPGNTMRFLLILEHQLVLRKSYS